MKRKTAPLRQGFAGLEFPKIYRFFTEKREWGFIFAFLVSLLLILIFSLDLLNNIRKEKQITEVRRELEKEAKVWEEIANKYQGYKDAYFQLGLIQYKLGNFDRAKYYLDKALFVDPNFEKARNLQNILKGY